MMDRILSEGRAIQIPQGYRLIRNERAGGQKVVMFGPIMCEFGQELICWKPCVAHGIRLAKKSGYHVVVASRISRHPLYLEADEFWGVAPFGGFSQINGVDAVAREAFGSCEDAEKLEFMDKGSTYPASHPSMEAKRKADEIAVGKRIVCLCARYRGAEGSRNFPYWQEVVDGILEVDPSLEIICTSTKPEAYDLKRVKYLQDMVGNFNTMDVEIALNRKALCCVSSNTGSLGVMIYGLTPHIVVLGGTFGLRESWHRLRIDVANENGCVQTSMEMAEGGDAPGQALCHYIGIYKNRESGLKYAGQAVERVREHLAKSRDLAYRVDLD